MNGTATTRTPLRLVPPLGSHPPEPDALAPLRVRWLGKLPYAEAWDLQRGIWSGKMERRVTDDYLLLVEHPPVITVGRNGDGSNLRVSAEILRQQGVEWYEVDRGGDVTYHGPGQLVGYPLIYLEDPMQVVPYVRRLEQVLIDTLADFGVPSFREPGLTGVWTDRGKVAAIGVRVSRKITMHGFALNLDPDLTHFRLINPCGITDRPVTSLTELLGQKVSLEEGVEALIPHFVEVFGYPETETQLAAFTPRQGKSFEVDRLLAQGTFSADRSTVTQITVNGRLPGEPPRPDWMRVTARMPEGFLSLKKLMREAELNTVCEEAKCPNIYECWSSGTATLMILGDKCTRACGFCDVNTGRPDEVDTLEPYRAAQAVRRMGLSHAVVTSVNRDDLADGGASIFAATIRQTRRLSPQTDIEVLIPDFKGDLAALDTVLGESPEVLNHNTETVLRLQREIRTAANYGRSLALLWRAKQQLMNGRIKSGLIVGMGETETEVRGALVDLRAIGVDIVTIGQYLRPSVRHRPIHRYAPPAEFERYQQWGEELGIPHVESGPLVRSSYHAKSGHEAARAAAV